MNILEHPQVEIKPPRQPLSGRVWLPGSKSLTNRALLIAALAQGQSTLSSVLISDDTLVMITALRALGIEINQHDQTTLIVKSSGTLKAPQMPLFLGNAGTATRFLTAAAALADGQVVIDGDKHMRQRPIQPLVDALRSLGVDASTATGCPPVTINARKGFSGKSVQIDANLSSQYVSALLMLAACGDHPVEISLTSAAIGGRGYIELTLALMQYFGSQFSRIGDHTWRIEPTGYAAKDYVVEPDASSCTYLWAAEVLTGGRISFQVDSEEMSQPDAKALQLIRMFPHLPSVIDGSQIQDAIPTLAIMAAFNENPVRFVGISNLRVKECDRIHALSSGLCRLRNNLAIEVDDDLLVYGDPKLSLINKPTIIDSWNDHRIAMSFALAGLLIDGIVIDNPACVAKTFPDYWKVLSELGVELKAA